MSLSYTLSIVSLVFLCIGIIPCFVKLIYFNIFISLFFFIIALSEIKSAQTFQKLLEAIKASFYISIAIFMGTIRLILGFGII
jgi:preprotein translocase subunit YajC